MDHAHAIGMNNSAGMQSFRVPFLCQHLAELEPLISSRAWVNCPDISRKQYCIAISTKITSLRYSALLLLSSYRDSTF